MQSISKSLKIRLSMRAARRARGLSKRLPDSRIVLPSFQQGGKLYQNGGGSPSGKDNQTCSMDTPDGLEGTKMLNLGNSKEWGINLKLFQLEKKLQSTAWTSLLGAEMTKFCFQSRNSYRTLHKGSRSYSGWTKEVWSFLGVCSIVFWTFSVFFQGHTKV